MFSSAVFGLAQVALTTAVTRSQAPSGVPSYVVDYAPVVYLYSGEHYYPSDIGAQLNNTQPALNYTLVTNGPNPLTLDNLNDLNADENGTDVYLTFKVDIETNPAWLFGVTPDSSGKTEGAVSCAIIVNDHGNGALDAFYMCFYSFNYGGSYLDLTVDDHVGDWEHSMVRFSNGTPTAIWYSQHDNGEAFTYGAIEKYNGTRPVAYSANGTHANYATNGTHDHTIPDVDLPDGLILDYTDKGEFWDPTFSAYYYSYNASSQTFEAYDMSTPVNWLYYLGKWGDDSYPTTDPRQNCLLDISGLCKYSSGPTGPVDKQLNRREVCPEDGDLCIVRSVLTPGE